MKTVIITDCKYRSSIAAVRSLAKAGYHIVCVQTKADTKSKPPAFFSKYASEKHWIEGSVNDAEYMQRLISIIYDYERPVIFPVGAVTLRLIAENKNLFEGICDFLITSPVNLQALNDKDIIHRRAEMLGIKVPKQYDGEPNEYPVIIKPHFGEGLGLKAGDRYAIANNREEYFSVLETMHQYDPSPLVQQKIEGDAFGASLLIAKDGSLLSAVCHKRIREYPISGGPSTCCESIYDEELIGKAYELLNSFHFCGMAMVEFKGDCVLEVNPRVWGSFPMTFAAGSNFAEYYVKAACGEKPEYKKDSYKIGVRMRFLVNDTLAVRSYKKHGMTDKVAEARLDRKTAVDGIACKDDPAPMRHYLLTLWNR